MKSIIYFIISFIFSTVIFSQGVPKEKNAENKKKVEEVKEVIVTDTSYTVVETSPSTTNSGNTYSLTRLKNKNSKSLKNYGNEEDLDEYINYNDQLKLKMKDWYPQSDVEGYVSLTSHSNQFTKITGGTAVIKVRQVPKIKNLGNLSKEKAKKINVVSWGLFVEGGKYKVDITEIDKSVTSIDVQQIGGGISYGRTRNRPGFNAITFDLGVFREVEDLTHGKYEARQVDTYFKLSSWIDLTRKRDKTFFSRTSFSFYWKKPFSSRKTALYDRKEIDAEIWDKEAIGCKFEQTMLMFHLGDYVDNVGLHVILSLGYDNYKANQDNLWTPGIAVEVHSKDFKIGSIYFGKKTKSNDPSVRGSYDVFEVNLDFYRLARAIID